MSAYVVSKEHIDTLVGAGLSASPYDNFSWYHDGERHQLTLETADAVGQMLWDENEASVSYRYSPPGREAIYGEAFGEANDAPLPGTYRTETIVAGVAPVEVAEWVEPYCYSARKAVSPVAVLKAISSYEYQACEHPDWKDSSAAAFCDSLRLAMIHNLPGYEDASWTL